MPKVVQNNELGTSQNELGYEFDFFCSWLGIYKYICMIQSIHVGVDKHSWAS